MECEPRSVGRKQLIPALSSEVKCPHNYRNDDELLLEVECSECPGTQDLTNNRCLAGILQILCSEARPNIIILKRHIHRRYRESALLPVLEAASDLAAMNRALSTRPEPSDRRCQTCEASVPRLVNRVRRELLDSPMEFISDRRGTITRLHEELGDVDCMHAPACVRRALGVDSGRGGNP
ncbi:MAG: hypothetical protein OEM29_02135 [Thermoplasmata archaeon]|nr:hypothetical protein [Thermoplasmata archaeon]